MFYIWLEDFLKWYIYPLWNLDSKDIDGSMEMKTLLLFIWNSSFERKLLSDLDAMSLCSRCTGKGIAVVNLQLFMIKVCFVMTMRTNYCCCNWQKHNSKSHVNRSVYSNAAYFTARITLQVGGRIHYPFGAENLHQVNSWWDFFPFQRYLSIDGYLNKFFPLFICAWLYVCFLIGTRNFRELLLDLHLTNIYIEFGEQKAIGIHFHGSETLWIFSCSLANTFWYPLLGIIWYNIYEARLTSEVM